MPATRLRPLRLPALLAAVTVLLAVALAMVVGIQRLESSARWVRHSYQVTAAIERYVHVLRSAESAARGYRLIERPELRDEYLALRPEIAREADALVALVQDHRAQSQRAQALRRLGRTRLQDIEQLLAIQAEQGAERARAATLGGTGAEQMRGIEAMAAAMSAQEQRLLAGRLASNRAAARLLTVVATLGVALPAALVAWLMGSLWRENTRALRLERQAQTALRDATRLLAQRDRLVRQHRSLGTYAGLLQSSQSLEEAMAMTANVVGDLLPGTGGRCYVLRASQNLAESAATFGEAALATPALLAPTQCWALRRGQPYRADSGHNALRCTHYEAGASDTVAWTLCVPLLAQGTHLGLLHVNGHGTQDEADLSAIEAVGEQLSLAMINLQLRDTLRVQSLRDPLTGLFNRRYLEENMQRELQRCQRRGLPLSVLMVDVDHFKAFNDTHGHAAGDVMLARVAQVLQAMTREEDIACRYGGEEFTLVLPETNVEDALRRADEIRRAIGGTTVQHLRQTLGPSTASVGVATFPANGATPAALMEAADAALYRAKAQGRNAVVAAG